MTLGSRIRGGLLACAAAFAMQASQAQESASSASPFALGSVQTESSFAGRWIGLIYGEAFRRLGIPMKISVYPILRLSMSSDRGDVDGDVARVHAYAAAHPELVRVEESVLTVQLALYTADPALSLRRLEDIPSADLRATFVRGAAVCEKSLKPWMAAGRLVDVNDDGQALKMLLARRTDVHCTTDLGVENQLRLPEFKGVSTIRPVLVLGEAVELYPYLHRRHAALAPRLAATLRQMKAEGLIEAYRAEAMLTVKD